MTRRSLPPAKLLIRGPYKLAIIGTRINDKRQALELKTTAVCHLLGWTEGMWSEKMRGKGSSLSVPDISAICAAFEMLHAGWKTPPGWPFVEEATSSLLQKELDRQHDK